MPRKVWVEFVELSGYPLFGVITDGACCSAPFFSMESATKILWQVAAILSLNKDRLSASGCSIVFSELLLDVCYMDIVVRNSGFIWGPIDAAEVAMNCAVENMVWKMPVRFEAPFAHRKRLPAPIGR